MLYRRVIDQLKNRKNKPKKKSLIILGARQIGKTYAVRECGKEYKSFVELNFIEHPEYKSIFDGALDVETLKMNIIVNIPRSRFIEDDTLILFDEIQECGQALQSLKFWTEDGRYDVIATGSALGINLNRNVSYPVGNVEYLDMYALDFPEYIRARGITEEMMASISGYARNMKAIPSAMHNKLMQLLREYMILGGMPEVVDTFIQTESYFEADAVQRRIYRDYLMDIAHYAPANIKIKAQKCFESIPLQLTKDNHKFQYGVVEHKSTAAKYETSIEWLNAAFITKQINNIKRFEYPLKAFSEENNFRLYNTDIGMLMAGFDFSLKQALFQDGNMEETSPELNLKTAKGGLYEALACDMLVKKGVKDIYFYKDIKSTAEIEFVIEGPECIAPIEIKAGRKKANSLGRLLEDEKIAKGYKFSSQNLGVTGKIITMPMYLLPLL